MLIVALLASFSAGPAMTEMDYQSPCDRAADVVGLGYSAEVEYGTFDDCLKTLEYTPLSPDAFEFKFYAPGIGLALEVNPDSGETVERVDIAVMK